MGDSRNSESRVDEYCKRPLGTVGTSGGASSIDSYARTLLSRCSYYLLGNDISGIVYIINNVIIYIYRKKSIYRKNPPYSRILRR